MDGHHKIQGRHIIHHGTYDGGTMNENDDKKVCPECGSHDVATILWGMPAYDEELERDLDKGRIVLGGCCIPIGEIIPEFHCNACGCEFGDRSELL